jgi:hypothetical protein
MNYHKYRLLQVRVNLSVEVDTTTITGTPLQLSVAGVSNTISASHAIVLSGEQVITGLVMSYCRVMRTFF